MNNKRKKEISNWKKEQAQKKRAKKSAKKLAMEAVSKLTLSLERLRDIPGIYPVATGLLEASLSSARRALWKI